MDKNTIVVDTGQLPCWPTLQAINISYTESVVRLSNALSMTELTALPDLTYRFHVSNPDTGEKRVVVYKGGEDGNVPISLPFSVAVSILAIIRLKDYTAMYTARSISAYFSEGGSGERMSDMDRIMVLFESRPEFAMYALSDNIEGDYVLPEEAEDQEEEEEVPTADLQIGDFRVQ